MRMHACMRVGVCIHMSSASIPIFYYFECILCNVVNAYYLFFLRRTNN